MAITDLIPWVKKKADEGEEERSLQVREDPFLSFQQQMNHLFDGFLQTPGLQPLSSLGDAWDAFSPRVDIQESAKEIRVLVELPGMEEEEIDVSLSRNILTISGEKRQEREKKGRRFVRTERSYGAFRRSIPLSAAVDYDRVDAQCRNGVLAITLPRKDRVEVRKRIAVNTD